LKLGAEEITDYWKAIIVKENKKLTVTGGPHNSTELNRVRNINN